MGLEIASLSISGGPGMIICKIARDVWSCSINFSSISRRGHPWCSHLPPLCFWIASWFCTSLYTHIRFRLHHYNNRSCNLVGSVFPQIGKVLIMVSRSRAFSQSQSVSVVDSRIRLEYFCRKQCFSASYLQPLLSQEVRQAELSHCMYMWFLKKKRKMNILLFGKCV